MSADLAGEWDDADQDLYDQRIARARAAMAEEASVASEEDAAFDGGFKVPGSIFSRLFDYQKTGELSDSAVVQAGEYRDCWKGIDSAGACHLCCWASLREALADFHICQCSPAAWPGSYTRQWRCSNPCMLLMQDCCEQGCEQGLHLKSLAPKP